MWFTRCQKLVTMMLKSLVVLLLVTSSVCGGVDATSTKPDTFKTIVNALVKEGSQCRLEVQELRSRIVQLESKLEDILTQFGSTKEKKDVSQGDEIAFTATRSTNEAHLQPPQPIIFDQVITNIGNAYNPQTGIFTCPISGTYLFHMNVVSDDANYVEVFISLNGNHVVGALSDHKATDISWDQGGTAAILQLSSGDVVTVEIHHPPGDNNIHGNKFTTFSGYMLRAYQ